MIEHTHKHNRLQCQNVSPEQPWWAVMSPTLLAWLAVLISIQDNLFSLQFQFNIIKVGGSQDRHCHFTVYKLN